jgi:hypothetical protein
VEKCGISIKLLATPGSFGINRTHGASAVRAMISLGKTLYLADDYAKLRMGISW